MHKYSFYNDYSEGAHPGILELMAKTNLDQEDGYGNDTICLRAQELIKGLIENPQAAVHFVSGGTQANLIVLASLLKPYEAVITAITGHINVHETGAIEATGHKVLTVASKDGKLTVEGIQSIVDQHDDEHMVKPRAVYISNTTEVGTVYQKAELESIAGVCRANGLYLFLDGARLGSALTSSIADLTLPEIARLVDVFYIGGTKNGALLGEAIVINRQSMQENFRFHLKQRGALLAKGRLLGVQFLGLLQDGLYFKLAQHANAMAGEMAQGLAALGFDFLTPPVSNQIFPILPNTLIAALQERYGFYTWSKVDEDRSAVRLVCSWAMPEEKVAGFIEDLLRLVMG